MKRVSFDFDMTLGEPEVQDYAKSLIDRGIEVWIVTARYHYSWQEPSEVADKLGIPRSRIIFTCSELKFKAVQDLRVLWHLDDDNMELEQIARYSNIPAIDVKSSKWRGFCEKFI